MRAGPGGVRGFLECFKEEREKAGKTGGSGPSVECRPGLCVRPCQLVVMPVTRLPAQVMPCGQCSVHTAGCSGRAHRADLPGGRGRPGPEPQGLRATHLQRHGSCPETPALVADWPLEPWSFRVALAPSSPVAPPQWEQQKGPPTTCLTDR